MKHALLSLSVALLFACGKPAPTSTDAGYVPDESCGLDCAAQTAFNLQVNRCFEYTGSPTGQAAPTADLGVLVRKVNTLEGGVKTLEVEYRQSGLIQMTDQLRFDNGNLLLVRRSVKGGQRVQYEDMNNNLVGVPWVGRGMAAGDSLSASTVAGLLKNGEQSSVPTTFKTTAVAADSAEELTTPLKAYESGIKLIFNETPNHGAETRRIFVNEVGFVAFTARFELNDTAPSTFYRLQKIRDVGAGDVDCGLGEP